MLYKKRPAKVPKSPSHQQIKSAAAHTAAHRFMKHRRTIALKTSMIGELLLKPFEGDQACGLAALQRHRRQKELR
ncbi:hypothetical protein [Halotalea alkalilenta]|uniref:hypothetical protein n=1 Tax=Halotalea alkalilenta TaxID=376489 RepID=UPI0012DE26D1|nr:hypothetical protein [Halotalea alkalilenta]